MHLNAENKLSRFERDNLVRFELEEALKIEYQFACDEHGPYEHMPQAYKALVGEVKEARDEMLRVDTLTGKIEAAIHGFIPEDKIPNFIADIYMTALAGAHELIQVAAVARKFFDLLYGGET